MKKLLQQTYTSTYYFKDGVRTEGVHAYISGDVSGIYGNVSGIYGDVSGISGDVSDIYGDVSSIRGNLDDCEIQESDRETGIDIKDLIVSA